MEVKLIITGGKKAGQEISITAPKFFIGRAKDCQLRLGSDLISRHHCVILVEEDFVAVRDFGSKNGTYVNDQRVRTEQELATGDQLKVGSLAFEVQLVVGLGGKKKPKVRSVQEAAARTAHSPKPPADDDVDLADWFGDEEDAAAGSASTETQTIEAAHTEIVGGKAADVPDAPEEDPERKPKEKKEEGKSVGVSKSTKITAASTQDAAAEALKNFRRR